MPLILAIDRDKRQSTQLAGLVKAHVGAELVQNSSAADGLAALDGRVPDVILTSSLISPKDDAALAAYLRELGAAAGHVQSVTIPLLGKATPARTKGGMLSALRRGKQQVGVPDACAPEVFAEQIRLYLDTSQEQKVAAAARGLAAQADAPVYAASPVAIPDSIDALPVDVAPDLPIEAAPDEILYSAHSSAPEDAFAGQAGDDAEAAAALAFDNVVDASRFTGAAPAADAAHDGAALVAKSFVAETSLEEPAQIAVQATAAEPVGAEAMPIDLAPVDLIDSSAPVAPVTVEMAAVEEQAVIDEPEPVEEAIAAEEPAGLPLAQLLQLVSDSDWSGQTDDAGFENAVDVAAPLAPAAEALVTVDTSLSAIAEPVAEIRVEAVAAPVVVPAPIVVAAPTVDEDSLIALEQLEAAAAAEIAAQEAAPTLDIPLAATVAIDDLETLFVSPEPALEHGAGRPAEDLFIASPVEIESPRDASLVVEAAPATAPDQFGGLYVDPSVAEELAAPASQPVAASMSAANPAEPPVPVVDLRAFESLDSIASHFAAEVAPTFDSLESLASQFAAAPVAATPASAATAQAAPGAESGWDLHGEKGLFNSLFADPVKPSARVVADSPAAVAAALDAVASRLERDAPSPIAAELMAPEPPAAAPMAAEAVMPEPTEVLAEAFVVDTSVIDAAVHSVDADILAPRIELAAEPEPAATVGDADALATEIDLTSELDMPAVAAASEAASLFDATVAVAAVAADPKPESHFAFTFVSSFDDDFTSTEPTPASAEDLGLPAEAATSLAAAPEPAPAPATVEPPRPVLDDEALSMIGEAARKASLDAFVIKEFEKGLPASPRGSRKSKKRSSHVGATQVTASAERVAEQTRAQLKAPTKKRPLQDEWGMFDPEQCFAGLDDEGEPAAEPARTPGRARVVTY